MDGRKLVRVNDVRIAILSNGTYMVAVDVGLAGFFPQTGRCQAGDAVPETF